MDAVDLHITKAVSDAARALRRGRCSDRGSGRRPWRCRLVLACDGPLLRPFSLSADEYAAGQHRGIDIGAAAGDPVRAPAAGIVSFVGPVPAGGRALTIQTADGYAVTLLQLGSVAVTRGSSSEKEGSSARSATSDDAFTTAPHVHLGVRVAADPNGYVDPLGLLPAVASPVPVAPETAPPPGQIRRGLPPSSRRPRPSADAGGGYRRHAFAVGEPLQEVTPAASLEPVPRRTTRPSSPKPMTAGQPRARPTVRPAPPDERRRCPCAGPLPREHGRPPAASRAGRVQRRR